MRKLDVSNAIVILLLVVTLFLVPTAEAATWSSPSMVTDPSLCGMGISGCPSISGDGSKIAFATGMLDNAEIFTINSDGTGPTQLTNSTEFDNAEYFAEPSINYDGSKIVFSCNSHSGGEIFVVNSDGTGLRQLTDNAERDWAPDISGDGSRIVFQRSPNISPEEELRGMQIFVINSDGTGLVKLTDDSERSFMFPSISDNGEKIAFWSHFSRSNPESTVDFEYENVVSLVSYLADVEGENGTGSIFPAAMVVGGILTVAVGAMVILYLKKKPGKL